MLPLSALSCVLYLLPSLHDDVFFYPLAVSPNVIETSNVDACICSQMIFLIWGMGCVKSLMMETSVSFCLLICLLNAIEYVSQMTADGSVYGWKTSWMQVMNCVIPMI